MVYYYFCNMEKSKIAIKAATVLSKYCQSEAKSRYLVCVSGGADSVALLRVLLSLGCSCVAAHCNFGLRGSESDADDAFVEDLCKKLGVELVKTRFDVAGYIAEHKGASVEMACRELRYAWFHEQCELCNCNYIAVGHNFNDREETFILNMLRGTGVRGLASIKYRNEKIVRPLLDATRREIEEYLEECGSAYRTDSTNLGNDYERNKVRNLLLPYMRELFPDNALARTVKNMADAGEFYEQALEKMRLAYVNENFEHGIVEVDIAGLKAEKGWQTILHEMLVPYGFNSQQAEAMATAEQGATFLSKKYKADYDRGKLLISEQKDSDAEEISFVLGEGVYPEGLCVTREKYDKEYKFARDNRTLYLSTEILGKTLVWRHWKEGDVIYPYGMKGRKRLVSDIFSDAKKSPVEKRAIRILECEGKILWVAGLRASQYYSVAEGEEMVVITMPAL